MVCNLRCISHAPKPSSEGEYCDSQGTLGSQRLPTGHFERRLGLRLVCVRGHQRQRNTEYRRRGSSTFCPSRKYHSHTHRRGANIQLSRWGTIEGTYLGFNIVPLDKSTSDLAARGLCMSSAGRIRTVKGADIPCTN